MKNTEINSRRRKRTTAKRFAIASDVNAAVYAYGRELSLVAGRDLSFPETIAELVKTHPVAAKYLAS